MALTKSDLMPRVERGAAWLDEQKPGWHRQVTIATLDLNDCTACVMGQLYGEYETGIALSSFPKWSPDAGEWSDARGFSVFDQDRCQERPRDRDAAWNLLRDCWIDAILLRRSRDASTLQSLQQAVDASPEAVPVQS